MTDAALGSMAAAPPASARLIRRGLVITVIGLVGLGLVYFLALVVTPTERWQGLAQKILYVHAPAATTTLVSFLLTGVASVAYLWLKDPRIDAFAESSAEVGLAFGAMMLTTGPIWAKPIWGAWWQWEPRLTLTLLLVLLFIGYRALRSAIDDPEERARYSAVVGVMALVLVPFVHLSVYLFRTIHPQPVVLKPSEPTLPWEMLRTLLVSWAVFHLPLYIGFVTTRYGLARRAQEEAAA
ncbi:MAG: cytochrome c biogenesis protein CcsA [Gemmatimonadales bacterium]